MYTKIMSSDFSQHISASLVKADLLYPSDSTFLQIDRLPMLKVVERHYPALRGPIQSDGLAPRLFQAGINCSNVKIALTSSRIDPGPEPTIRFPEVGSVALNKFGDPLGDIRSW